MEWWKKSVKMLKYINEEARICRRWQTEYGNVSKKLASLVCVSTNCFMKSVMLQLLIQALFHLSVADFMYLELHFFSMNNVCACEIIWPPLPASSPQKWMHSNKTWVMLDLFLHWGIISTSLLYPPQGCWPPVSFIKCQLARCYEICRPFLMLFKSAEL